MTVDEPEADPGLSPQALAAIARGMALQADASMRDVHRRMLASLPLPEDSLDSLLRIWILARRRDEGMTRPMKRGDLDMQVGLARRNAPLMAVIQAAYRMALTDQLDYLTDQEQQP